MKLFKSLAPALKEREGVQALKLTIKKGAFPSELLDFPNIEELYLDGVCESFPATFFGWEKLKILTVKWPSFKGNLTPIFQLPNLVNLKIIETPMSTLLLPLGHARAPLTTLTIKDCGLKSLPHELSILDTLEEMNLSGNKLAELPLTLTELTRLKRLNLDHNSFTHFPDHVRKVPRLQHLSMDGNLFSQEEKERVQRDFHLWIN